MAENKLDNLYKLLKADSNYSSAKVLESPETFKQTFSSDDKINNLYSLLRNDKKYSSAEVLKTPDIFKQTFFSPVDKTTVPKKEEPFSLVDYVSETFKGIANWFSPEEATKEQVSSQIKSEQNQERNVQLPEPDLKKDIERDKKLFESFKRSTSLDLDKQGIKYDESLLNQETLKKLNGLGYNYQPFSKENPTLVLRQNAPTMSIEDIEEARMKAAQSYTDKIEKVQSENAYSARFLPDSYGWSLVAGFLSPTMTAEEIRKKDEELKKLEREKLEVDEQYKAARVFQSNKYTASTGGVSNGFISTQISPDEAILEPEKALETIKNSYTNLFKDDEIARAQSSPEAKEAYKKSLIEKSVFTNNDFKENALIELKAMEEEKSDTELGNISEKLGLGWWKELVAPELKRGFSSLDEQYHLSQQIKREKEPIIQSIKQDEAFKNAYQGVIDEYIKNKKAGRVISLGDKTLDETWFKSSLNTISALDASIKKKKSDLNFLESVELNDTKDFKKFQKDQEIFNELGDKSRTVFSIFDSAKDFLRAGEKIADILYMTLGVDDDETVDFRGTKLKREEIESAKLSKPLREIDQYYELIPKIGDVSQRVKSSEAEGIRIFDEEGNFSPDMDFAALAGATVKVAAVSRTLGFAAVAEELTVGAAIESAALKLGVEKGAGLLLKESLKQTSRAGLGYILPSNLLLGAESVKRYMQKGYNFDQAFSLSTIDNTIEGLTELIAPNDALIVKNMILKGEIKTAKELTENEIYKGAFKKSYKAWTGKNLSDAAYNTLKAYGPSAKFATKVLLEETGEEITGEALRSLAYKTGLTKENPILDEPGNFTLANIANIAISTMATMLPTAGSAFVQNYSQIDKTRTDYQYLVGQNVKPYVKATLDLYSKNEITDNEAKRRLKAISDFENLYSLSAFQAQNASNYDDLKDTEKEALGQKFFFSNSKRVNLEKAILEAPTDEQKEELIDLLESVNLELNDLKLGLYKSDEERVKLNVDSTKYFINENSVKSFEKVDKIDNLIKKYEGYKTNETNEEILKSYDSAIELLKNRKTEIIKKQEEDAKSPTEKASESESKGTIQIVNKRGEKFDYQIGKKYIVNRQIAIGQSNPIRFPEVTFLGYKKNEDGSIAKDEKDSPIVIFKTVDTSGKEIINEKPSSYFQDYFLGTKENLLSTAVGRFYNNFKSKKFILKLKNNKGVYNYIYNNLKNISKQDLEGVDELSGYLSIEMKKGKPALYFNFINPKTGKEGYYEVNDTLMKYSGSSNGFLRPVEKSYTTKTGEKIIKSKQYEDLTPEEMEEMGFFTEKELEEYKKYVETQDYSELEAERKKIEKLRREIIEEYLKETTQPLTDITKEIEELTSSMQEYKELMDQLEALRPITSIARYKTATIEDFKKILTEQELKKFNKLTSPYEKMTFLKNSINTKIEKYSKKIESASKKIEKLSAKKERIQPLIEEQLNAIKEIEESEEIDFAQTIIPQLKERIRLTKEAIKENTNLIDELKGNIGILQDVIQKIKEKISELFSSFAMSLDPDGLFEKTQELDKSANEAEKSIDDAKTKIAELQKKNKVLKTRLEAFKEIKNRSEKIEKEIQNITSAFRKEKIKKFLFEQQETAGENPTGANLEDKNIKDERTSKYFEDLFRSTTSFGYTYDEDLKDPKNNYANARLDFFFNNFKGTFDDKILVPINKKNAEKLGLTDILYDSQIDTDVKLVVAQVTKDGYVFIDMNGNPINLDEKGKVSPNSVIYTSLQKPTLEDSKGNKKYNLKDFEYLKDKFPKEEDRIAEIEKIVEEERAEYEKFRNSILESENPEPFKLTGISRGISQYNENEEGIQRNTVVPTLLPKTVTSFKDKIAIADKPLEKGSKMGAMLDHNGKVVNVPLGRPILWDKKTRTFQFLDNHKLSKQQKDALKAVIRQMVKDILDNFNLKLNDPNAKVKNISNYTRFVSGLLYWRNPENNKNNTPQNKEDISDKQMWFDFKESESYLVIGGKNQNKIALKDILTGDELLESTFEEIYQNVNKSLFGKAFTEYYVENNTIKERVWPTYENYLLSDKYPDNTTRPTEEIPLTVSIIPNDSPFDENGNFKENYTPQYKSRYFTFSTPAFPVRTNKKTETVKTEEKPPVSNPVSKKVQKLPSVIKDVNAYLEILQTAKPITVNSIKNWKEFIANLKEGVVYSYNFVSPRSIELNNGNSQLFTFSVSFDETGQIKVNDFKINYSQEAFDTIQIAEFKLSDITKEGLEEFLNIMDYNYFTEKAADQARTFNALTNFLIKETLEKSSVAKTEPKEEKPPVSGTANEIDRIDGSIFELERDLMDRMSDFMSEGFSMEEAERLAYENFPDEKKEALQKLKNRLKELQGKPSAPAKKEEPSPEIIPRKKQEEEKEEQKPTEQKPATGKRIIKRGGPRRDQGPKNYRIAKGEAKVKENIEKAKQWLEKTFPNVSLSFVDGLIDGVAWGKFVNNGIILSKAAEIGTIYHEAFEVVAGMFLNKRQWEELVREFRSRKGTYIDRETSKVVKYSEATDSQIKEELAEEYREYELTEGKSVLSGQYKRNSLFRRIWNAIKSLIFGDPKSIEDLFKKISSAQFKDKAPVKWNRPFNLEKSYRIANLQEDLFFYQLNKSLSLYIFRSEFEKNQSFDSLFKMKQSEFDEIYKEIKLKLQRDYFQIEEGKGEYYPITSYELYNYENLEDILNNYDDFFDKVVEYYESVPSDEERYLPSVIKDIFFVNNLDIYSGEEYYSIVKNKVKDALLAYSYIESNWDEIVKKNKKYLQNFNLLFEVKDDEGNVIASENDIDEGSQDSENDNDSQITVEEKKESVGRDEYTKDPFITTLKDSANSRIKLLIATLPSQKFVKSSSGVRMRIEQLNDLGLPEVVEFSKTFRKVISTVIEEPTLIGQLKALEKASSVHAELFPLYTRLGGDKTVEKISENENLWNLRISFNQTFNKQRFGFSRLLMKLEEKYGKGVTILTNMIDSLESSSYRAIMKKYLNGFKEIAARNPEWLDDNSAYVIPSNFIPPLSRTLEESIESVKKLGFDFPYELTDLTDQEKNELFEAVKEIINFVRSGQAKLENLKDFNFSKHVADLARIEYKITKDANEVQHRNIEGMPQSNDISQNAMSIVSKTLNAAKDIITFQKDLPRFNDVYTQNALWRRLYFENEEKNEVMLRMESAEGAIEDSGRGSHTSKLNYSTRILQEFIYNILGDSKNFKTPGFYVITPADIKTETVIKYGKILVEKPYMESKTGVFDYVLKGYLIDEIKLARELSKDDRGLKAYQKQIEGKFEGKRKLSQTLRFFNDILTFDYTDVIDNDIDINKWISENQDRILDDINNYFESEVDDTIDLFEEESILQFDPATETYDFIGMETQSLNHIDKIFGTTLYEGYTKTGKVTFTKEQIRELIKYRSINYFVNINEQSKLFFGDFGQFGDLTKRIKSFVSTRETTAYDNYSTNGEVYTEVAKKIMNKIRYTDELGNVEEVEIEEGVPGYQSFETSFKGSTIKDVEIIQSSISYIEDVNYESLAQDLFFSDFKSLPPAIQKQIRQIAKSTIEPFKKVNEADGSAYMCLPLYRQFLDRSSMWNDDLQELYDYHMAYERNKRNQYSKSKYGENVEKIREIDNKILAKGDPNQIRIKEGKPIIDYPVIKPIGAGSRPGNKFITTLDKCSIFPIHYKLLENKTSLSQYISAVDSDTQFFRFESAHKVGTPSEMRDAYNEKGIPNDILQTDELSFQDFAIQVETRSQKDKQSRGTQLLKLAFLNLMESGVPIDFVKKAREKFSSEIEKLKADNFEDFDFEKYIEEWKNINEKIISESKTNWEKLSEEEKIKESPVYKAVNDHNEILKTITDRHFKNLCRDFGIVKVEGTENYKIKNYDKFKEAIKKQLTDRKASNNLLRQIEIKNGKFVQPFDFVIGADKLEPVLMAIVNSRVTSPKIKGKGLAQVSSSFFDNTKRSFVKKVEKEDGTFYYEEVKDPKPGDDVTMTSSDLLFYGDYYVEENGITRRATKKEIKQGKAKIANFAEVYLPAIFKDTLGNAITDFNKIDPELLEAIGYRIPTQELANVENIRIKGFLPIEYQNGIVVPSSITAKAGSDFDIDKLTVYLYHYSFSPTTGKVKKINYLNDSNSTSEERYVEYIKEKLFKEKTDVIEDDEIAESLKLETMQEMGKEFTRIVRKKFENIPVFQEQSESFEKVVSAIKEYKNKKVGRQLLNILYQKDTALFDKYETITQLLDSEYEDNPNYDNKAYVNNIQRELDNLFMLDEKNKNIFRLLKESSKKTVGYSLLKGMMKEEQKELLARYAFMYSVPIEGVPTYQDFIKLPMDEQNTLQAIENKYIDSIKNLVTLSENRSRLVNPISSETIKKLAEKIEKLKTEAGITETTKRGGKKQGKYFGKYGSAMNNSYTRYSYQIGKEGVGIGAVGMTNHSVNQWLDTVVNNSAIQEISLYLPTNLINGKPNITLRRDSSGKWTSDNISEIITGFVDIAKDPVIVKINGNLNTAGIYIFSNKMGISFEYAALLINQPIVLAYEKSVEKAYSPIGRVRIRSNKGKPFDYVKNSIVNSFGTLSEDYTHPGFFSKKELEDMIVNQNNLTDSQKQDQLKLLQIYLDIKNLSDDLRGAVSTYNFDTDEAKNINYLFSKLLSNSKHIKKGSIQINSSNTFFENIKNAVVNYTSSITPLFKMFDGEYYKYVYPVIKNISEIRDRNKRELALDDVKKGFANYLLLTIPFVTNGDVTRYLKEGNYILQNSFKKLMIDTETSVNTRLRKLQNKMKNGEISTNFALSEFFRISKDVDKKTNNLTVFNRSKDPEYIDLMVNSINELRESTDPEIRRLAEDIIILALIQSGMNQSNVSISQYIPDDWFIGFSEIIIGNLSRIEPKELENHLNKFKSIYYANKWKDPKFTKKIRYKTINNEAVSKNPFIITPYSAIDEKGNVINSKLSEFQLKKFIVDRNTENRDFKKYNVMLFQRVEFENGDPVLIKTEKGFSYVYKEVTPLGQGQYSLEYSETSLINENVDSESDADFIKNLKDSGYPVTSLSEETDAKKPTKPAVKPTTTTYPIVNGIKTISEPYGVVTVETNPTKEKTDEFLSIIAPQIQQQAYKENQASYANWMFNFGLRWTRKTNAKSPVKIKSWGAKEGKEFYTYDTLDQNANPLPSMEVLQPIMQEIQRSLGIDMSNYDSIIGNIYLPGEAIATHRDTTEAESARNYPVIVYTIGNNSGINIYENEKNPGKASFASDKKVEIPTKDGTIYTFGMDGKGRFEVSHDTPKNIKRDVKYPPITLPDGRVVENYTITLTFRRAQEVGGNTGVPISPKKLTVATQPTPSQEIETAESIYSKLGNKTKSENIVIKPWSELKDATKAITPQGVVSTRIKMSDAHFGNPFTPDTKLQNLIQVKSTKEAVERYINWILTGETGEYVFTGIQPEELENQRKWILEKLKSGELKGKPIFYYKELREPSHATALDYLINKYDWAQPATQSTEVSEVEENIKKIEEAYNELTDEQKEKNGTLEEVINKFVNNPIPMDINDYIDSLNC